MDCEGYPRRTAGVVTPKPLPDGLRRSIEDTRRQAERDGVESIAAQNASAQAWARVAHAAYLRFAIDRAARLGFHADTARVH